jgi:hypothetical protein
MDGSNCAKNGLISGHDAEVVCADLNGLTGRVKLIEWLFILPDSLLDAVVTLVSLSPSSKAWERPAHSRGLRQMWIRSQLRSGPKGTVAPLDSFIGFGFVFSASQFQYPADVTFQPYI